MSSVFEFKNAVKKFGAEIALDEFNLQAEAGTVTVLLSDCLAE